MTSCRRPEGHINPGFKYERRQILQSIKVEFQVIA